MTTPHPPPRDLDAVWRWCSDLIDATTGELPLIGTPDWINADQATRVATLARFAVAALSLEEPHMVAYRLAVEATLGDAEYLAYRRVLTEVSHSVAGEWLRRGEHLRPHIPHEEMQRRRYPPSGDREQWIQDGPDRSAQA